MSIDARTAAAIAAGMQAVALADGEAHPRELALVAAFRAELPQGIDTSRVRITSDVARHALVRSLVGVALADGRVSDDERVVIDEIARAHGAADLVEPTIAEVRREMAATFAGARHFEAEARAIVRDLGLSGEEADAALAPPVDPGDED